MVKRHARIGEMVLGKPGTFGEHGDLLGARGLGSCVAVVIYDPYSKIAVLSHVALPERLFAPARAENKAPYNMKGRYAPTFLSETKVKIKSAGGKIHDLKAKIAGGAKMFSNLGKNPETINLGERNVNAVRKELAANNIPIIAESVLGTSSRTVWYNVDTQIMTVKIVNEGRIIHI